MFDLNDLPPPRDLPPGVRAEARRRLAEGIHDRPARPARTGLVIAVAAAAVAGTAVGIPMLTSGGSPSAGPGGVPVPSSPVIEEDAPEAPSVTLPLYDLRDVVTPTDTQRCAADGWKPMFTASAGGVTLVTLRSGDKRRFCELTPETVALSAPAARPASGVKITYVSATGTVAGVVADGEKSLSVRDPNLAEAYGSEAPAEIRDGVFVVPNGVTARPDDLTLLLGADLTPVEPGALPAAVTPRKDRPQPTRTGLASCTSPAGGPPLVDAHAWQAAAPVTLTATELVQTARYAGLLAFCLIDDAQGTARLMVTDGRAPATPLALEAGANPYVITYGAFYDFRTDAQGQRGSGTQLVAGLATDDRVARVILKGGDQPITAPVTDGMFVLPGVAGPHQYTLTLNAADGTTVATVPIGG
ncbi:hypothetical protein [Symbioplanes lichenis]|uniref:hypothetical protein n=1 Tax=Symbioplanes lichenis TaxID=1629072 RepID=UPI002739B5CC|nr:hypothetical protein [Actinoplanes lichenis]